MPDPSSPSSLLTPAPDLFREDTRLAYLEGIEHYRQHYGFSVYAYSLQPAVQPSSIVRPVRRFQGCNR